jgi:hypothetical protein
MTDMQKPEPRRSPTPCSPGCPGWAVFDSDNHGTIIDECIDCWHDVPDAPGPDYYAEHPVCVAALAAAIAAADDAPDSERTQRADHDLDEEKDRRVRGES